MSKFRSKTPVSQKEIQIQEIIHKNIQPIITTEIQPIINEKIQPVVHKEIQPIIHENIQPVITTEIQPVITKKIQPVIFMENQTNIEEVIQQLRESSPQTLKEVHTTENEILPQTKKEVKSINQVKVQPYIMKVEMHANKNSVAPEIKTIEQHMEIVEYVPYIQYKDGKILPYEEKEPNTINTSNITSDKDINPSIRIMEAIIAVNFVSWNQKINYPMACRKTDIFEKIEEKLYLEYPELKSKRIYFIANGKAIDKSSTLEENKIKNGNTILINEME